MVISNLCKKTQCRISAITFNCVFYWKKNKKLMFLWTLLDNVSSSLSRCSIFSTATLHLRFYLIFVFSLNQHNSAEAFCWSLYPFWTFQFSLDCFTQGWVGLAWLGQSWFRSGNNTLVIQSLLIGIVWNMKWSGMSWLNATFHASQHSA